MTERKTGVILSYLSLFLGMAISFLYTPFMLRTLGQDEYGLFSLANATVSYLTVLDFGFGSAIIKYTAMFRLNQDKRRESTLYGMFFVIYLILSIVAFVVGSILAANAPAIFAHSLEPGQAQRATSLTMIAAINIAISFPLGIFSSILNGYERYTFIKALDLAKTVINPLTMVGVLLLGYGSIGMLCATVAIGLLLNIIRAVYCFRHLHIRIRFASFDRPLFKEIIVYAAFIFIALVVDQIFWSTDSFILGIVSDRVSEVAVYTLSNTFVSIFINITSIIGAMYLPHFTRMVETKEPDSAISDAFIRVSRLQFFICLFIWGGFMLVGKNFILFWAGEAYTNTYYVALIIMSCLVAGITQNVGIAVLQAKNLVRFRACLQLAMAAGNILMTIPFAYFYGAVGAAWATFIAHFFGIFIGMSIYYQKRAHLNVIGLWKQLGRYIPNYLIIFIVCALIAWLLSALHLPLFANVVCVGAAYSLLYGLITYFFHFNTYEKSLVSHYLSKLRIRKG